MVAAELTEVEDEVSYHFAFANDPINKCDPTGLAPLPVWSVNVPTNPKDVPDLGTVTQLKNEAYNRSAFYWDHQPPAPPFSIPSLPGTTAQYTPEDYPAENKHWWLIFKAYEAREKELQGPLTQLQTWLNNNPNAKYGSYQPTAGPSMTAPGAKQPGVTTTTYQISRPWSVAAWNVMSAGAIGKGGPGSPTLTDVDPSSGYVQPERARPGTPNERIDPNDFKNAGKDAKANALESAAEVGASALQEGLNGLKQVDVVVWTLDSNPNISGFYVVGQGVNIGDQIIQSWAKPQGDVWNRGKW